MPSAPVRPWFNKTIIGLAAGVLLVIGAAGIIAGGPVFSPVFMIPALLGISGIILIYIEYAVRLWEQDDTVLSMAMVFIPLMFYYFSVLNIHSAELFLVFLAVNSVIFLILSLIILVCGVRVKWVVRKLIYHQYYYKKSLSPPAGPVPAITAIFLLLGIILLVNGSAGVITNINSITGGHGISQMNEPQLDEGSLIMAGGYQVTREKNTFQSIIFPVLVPGQAEGYKLSLFQDFRSVSGQTEYQTRPGGSEDAPAGYPAVQEKDTSGPSLLLPDENGANYPGPAMSPDNTPPAAPSPVQSPVQVSMPEVHEVTTISVPPVTETVSSVSTTAITPTITSTITTASMQELPAPGIPCPGFERAVLDRFNSERVLKKLKPFGYDTLLSGIAREHSVDMAVRGYFSRTDPGGKSPTTRAMDAGFPVRKTLGEGMYRTGISESIGQVAADNLTSIPVQSQAEILVSEWVKTPEDRSYLMNPDYDLIGIGIASNGSVCFITVDVW